MDIKERMYTVIQKRGIRQSELAKITGTTRQTINSYIHGRHQMRLEAIVLIASALHVFHFLLFPRLSGNKSGRNLPHLPVDVRSEALSLFLQAGVSHP